MENQENKPNQKKKDPLNWENTDYKWCDIGDYPEPLHFGVSLLLKNIDLKKELYKKTIKADIISNLI